MPESVGSTDFSRLLADYPDRHDTGAFAVAAEPSKPGDLIFDRPIVVAARRNGNQIVETLRRHGTGPDLVGQGGQADLHPFLGLALDLPVQGWCWPNFSNSIMAGRLGPAYPRSVGWNGAGGWLP